MAQTGAVPATAPHRPTAVLICPAFQRQRLSEPPRQPLPSEPCRDGSVSDKSETGSGLMPLDARQCTNSTAQQQRRRLILRQDTS